MKSKLLTFLSLIWLSCASAPPPLPTREHPLPMCRVSCPKRMGANRMLFQQQHLCSGGTRDFEDFIAIGESTVRGADGEILTAVWIGAEKFFDRGSTTPQWREIGDFPKSDVELGTCSSVIARIVQSRSTEQRGQHPGEDLFGNPSPP